MVEQVDVDAKRRVNENEWNRTIILSRLRNALRISYVLS